MRAAASTAGEEFFERVRDERDSRKPDRDSEDRF
jgi:hypothetical protein